MKDKEHTKSLEVNKNRPSKCPDIKCKILYNNCEEPEVDREGNPKSYICTGKLFKNVNHCDAINTHAFCIFTVAKGHIMYSTNKEDLTSVYAAFDAIFRDKEEVK